MSLEISANLFGVPLYADIKIDKKLIRKVKNKTLVADTKKARKIFKFRPTTTLDQLVKIMIQNDLRIEKDKKE